MKIGVVGAGRWGATLSALLSWQHDDVTLFCLQEDLEALTQDRVVPTTRIPLSKTVKLSMNKATLAECEVVFIAVPGQHLEEAWEMWGSFIQGTVVVAVKSIGEEGGELVFPLDMIDYNNKVFLGCAGFPQELLKKRPSPSIATAYSHSEECAKQVQELFDPHVIRVYRSHDIDGGQLGSALKNVIAIGCGMARGMGMGDMTVSMLISRGATEIQRLGLLHEADPKTFGAGSTFLADLIGTCTSRHSHNRKWGTQFASSVLLGTQIEEIGTVEGLQTIKILAKTGWLSELPIATAIHDIRYGTDPWVAAHTLLERELKPE